MLDRSMHRLVHRTVECSFKGDSEQVIPCAGQLHTWIRNGWSIWSTSVYGGVPNDHTVQHCTRDIPADHLECDRDHHLLLWLCTGTFTLI